MDCPLTKAVWMHLTTQLQQQELQQTPQRTISGWWKRLRRPFDKKQKPLVDGLYSLFFVEYLERTQSSNLSACLFIYSRSGIFDHKQHPKASNHDFASSGGHHRFFA
jgi:hypothetical protein